MPILFDKIIDRKSIYLSEKGYVGFSPFIDNFISLYWGYKKSDSVILDEFENYSQLAS